jgi:ligand-binding sensor domain-containing protein/two-component sensor histidine kinase
MNFPVVIKKMIVFDAIIFFITNFSLCSFSQASAYRFENITNEQGIADRVINAITQDTQGFIWIASIDGLTRYDGYNAIIYRHQTNNAYSVSDNEVYALCTDNDGYLWIGTRNGLNRYDAKHDRFETFLHDSADANSLAASEIFSLAKDIHGNIWIGTYNGGLDKLVKAGTGKGYKGSDYNFLHYRHDEKDSNSISNDQVFSVCFDKSGRAWIGTSNGLNVIDAAGKKISRLYNEPGNKNSISFNTINKIVADGDGAVWLCGKNMLDNVSFENDADKKIAVKHVLPLLVHHQNKNDWNINDFMIDRYNNYWVATNDEGVLKCSTGKEGAIRSVDNFVNNQSDFSLANTAAFSFYEDNAGVIWIGTAKGISKYIPAKARFNEPGFSTGSFFKNQITDALLYDTKNRLWIGSDSDTLTVIGNTPVHLLLPSSPGQFNEVNMLYQSSTGDIYVATFTAGLFIIPDNTENINDTRQWIHIDDANSQLPNNNIYAVAEDKKGIMWLGTYKGLSSYDPQTNRLKNVYVPAGGNVVSPFIIRTLFVDEKNVLWVGTDEGLVLIKDNQVVQKFYSDDGDSNSLNNNRVTTIYGDHNKNIWIGTKSGLNLFDPVKNNFKHFNPQNGSTVETVMSIKEDSLDNLWMGTNNGLVKYNITTRRFTKYTVEDGLCSNEFEAAAVCGGNNNYFYFGTANGLVSFNPSHIVSNSFIPPIVITDVKILDQPLASFADTSLVNVYRKEKKLVLRYDQNFFSFEFAALSYNNSKANQYAYILTGVDKQWHHAGTQHFADYTDIRPGHYIFKVKAGNNDGVWNNEPATVDVTIIPPWWQTWWFYTLCFLFACAVMYIIYRIRIQQILKLYKLRSSIAKDLHDDVGSALSSIALLSNISQEAKTKAALKPEDIFSRIGDTSKRMIDLMDDIVWSVNPDNDRFSNMLVRMREYAVEMLESKNIDFSFHIAKEIDELRIPMQIRKDYFLIFKEAINNLAKYSCCSNADISIEKADRTVVTIIADDGKGFDAQIINSGNGLINMRQRAATIKGKLNIETTEGKGTRITLSIPA